MKSWGPKAVGFAKEAGLTLDPWQAAVLSQSLNMRADGRWTAMESGLIVPRQNGKGAVIEARQLAALFLTKDRQIVYSAHRFKTAKAMYRRIRDLCKQTPDLDRVCKYRESNDETAIIRTDGGGRLDFFARADGAGRGFTGDTMFFDEAYDLDPELIADMLPTLSAVPNPQIWYVSSAGKKASQQLADVRARGIVGQERLLFNEWSAPDEAITDDLEALLISNPGIGYRLDLDFIQMVERTGMSEEAFRRERLGIWANTKGETVVNMNAWAELVDRSSSPGSSLAFAVDVAYDQSTATISLAGRRADGLAHLEVIDQRPGTAWVVERAKDLKAKWSPCAFVLDPGGPAGALLPDLVEAGVKPTKTTTRDYGQACLAFVASVNEPDRKVRHQGDPRLTLAVEAGRKRMMGESGMWGWTRRDETEITPLVSATLALWGLNTFGAIPSKSKAAFGF